MAAATARRAAHPRRADRRARHRRRTHMDARSPGPVPAARYRCHAAGQGARRSARATRRGTFRSCRRPRLGTSVGRELRAGNGASRWCGRRQRRAAGGGGRDHPPQKARQKAASLRTVDSRPLQRHRCRGPRRGHHHHRRAARRHHRLRRGSARRRGHRVPRRRHSSMGNRPPTARMGQSQRPHRRETHARTAGLDRLASGVPARKPPAHQAAARRAITVGAAVHGARGERQTMGRPGRSRLPHLH